VQPLERVSMKRLDKDELYRIIKKYGLNDKWRDYKRRGKR
jgi:hypothetical protein